jgi:transposase InsO family protein|tara:strand:+ start:34 stop:390 length:357 start_codon:yes stop_codon:yes gene_type:complete
MGAGQFNDGSCLRLKPLFRNHVWSYDFVADRTHEWRSFRILTLIDEYTRECLALKVRRHFKAQDVVEVLAELFLKRGLPCHIRSDNGPEFTAKVVRRWLEKFEIKLAGQGWTPAKICL